MTPESQAALKFVLDSPKPPTVKAFYEHFAPNGEALLQTILVSHVEEVKGKLVVNGAGKAIAKHFFGEEK